MARVSTKRGRKRKIINTEWSPELAYVVGLIATDGNLSPDRRHVNFTSKDEELVLTFKKILKLSNAVGMKSRGGETDKKYYVIQFGSIDFCEFLLSLGITNAKSKTLGPLSIPDKYFWDFLRGCLDGDGNINESSHPETKNTQLRLRFASASLHFITWQWSTIQRLNSVKDGWIYTQKNKSVSLLSFGKNDSIVILRKMYYDKNLPCLKRKFVIVEKYLG